MNRFLRRKIESLQKKKIKNKSVRFPKICLKVFEKQNYITNIQEIYLKHRQSKLQKDSKQHKRIENILSKPKVKSLIEIHHKLFITKKK